MIKYLPTYVHTHQTLDVFGPVPTEYDDDDDDKTDASDIGSENGKNIDYDFEEENNCSYSFIKSSLQQHSNINELQFEDDYINE
jgi:hypothetical protein